MNRKLQKLHDNLCTSPLRLTLSGNSRALCASIRRIKKKCLSWRPACLDEPLPRPGNSVAIRLLKVIKSRRPPPGLVSTRIPFLSWKKESKESLMRIKTASSNVQKGQHRFIDPFLGGCSVSQRVTVFTFLCLFSAGWK